MGTLHENQKNIVLFMQHLQTFCYFSTKQHFLTNHKNFSFKKIYYRTYILAQ